MTNEEFKAITTTLSQVVASPKAPTLASRKRDFARMNALEFHGPKMVRSNKSLLVKPICAVKKGDGQFDR